MRKPHKNINTLLQYESISLSDAAELLGEKEASIEKYVQNYGVRQCEQCRKRYFEPADINDTLCSTCFQLGFAEFNLEFMVDIDAIDEDESSEIRESIKKETSEE